VTHAWPERVLTYAVLIAAVLGSAVVLFLVGYQVDANARDGAPWGAPFWLAVGSLIPIGAVLAYRAGKRRGQAGDALRQRVAVVVFALVCVLLLTLGLLEAATTGI
jgi:hypothetical protein